jgi:hypothetical protein
MSAPPTREQLQEFAKELERALTRMSRLSEARREESTSLVHSAAQQLRTLTIAVNPLGPVEVPVPSPRGAAAQLQVMCADLESAQDAEAIRQGTEVLVNLRRTLP